MTDKKEHWAVGNSNAAKPKSEKNDVFLHTGCRSDDKKTWTERAESEGLTLAKFTSKVLNEYCEK